ncbi:transcription factor HHO3-like [Chenopodium quinoa]|nr:transcription factor HHO3-like [Chenopodium quinoa]
MMDFRNNMQKCQEYIHALEDEKKKIQVFQRELPLCLELVTQAIEACKQQLCGNGTTTTTECLNGHSECSEQTTSDGPILEEFMPLKRSNSTDDDDEDELESGKPQINNINLNNNNNNNEKSGKKSDWLRSVQLWNQTPDPPTTQEDHQPKKVVVVEVKRNGGGGAFQPFQKEKTSNGKENNDNNICNNDKQQPASTPTASACSSAQEAEMGPSSGGSGGGSKKDKDAQSQRKARRCWSPELHRRFVHALQQLGGSHVATPKQIRDLMKVDGLTNDEVKSHLQKYRLHTRRPSSGVHNNANQQTPQFVVVGGIWVPPEYAATTAGDTNTVAAPGNIYAPIATVATPPHLRQTSPHMQHQKQSSQSHCEERGSHSEGGVHSNSPATSSSTHTTTASHAH